ncbi:MAG TPA: hypothetical protein VMP11_08390 [Verrucomicrobiae bacterium]|nr:hypothetical protein [Verrucomicrobiae bacterium]
MHRTKKPRRGKGSQPEKSIFRQLWFVEMAPSPVTGEVRLRMERPAAWVCVADASELISCSVQKVHNLCEAGDLEWRWLDYKGPGGKKLVLVDSIQCYITSKS